MRSYPATICFPFVGDTVGGSHLSALLLIRHLNRGPFQTLTVVHEEGPLTEHLRREGVPYELLPLPAYAGRQPGARQQLAALARTVGPLRRFLRRRNVAIVHTQDARMHLTWTPPARLAGAATVWHQRTLFAPSRLARFVLPLASRVICNSHFVSQSLPPSAARRAQVVPNAVAPYSGEIAREDRRRELCQAAGVPANAVIVGMVGNLRAVKRPMSFVEAAACMQRVADRPLVFAVFGTDREGFVPRMRAYAAEVGLADRLLFMGFRHPVEPWIAACDLLLAPSVGDAFGRTLVEAMLVGVPVVAADAGGHGEIIRHDENGILVPPDDAEAMATAALALLRDPAGARALAERAHAEAQARYNVATHVERISKVYDALLFAGRTNAASAGELGETS